MDNNRTILAVVLIVLLWSGYSLFIAPQAPTPQVPIVKNTENVTTATNKKDERQIEKIPVESRSPSADIDNNLSETFVTVSSSYYDITLSSIGATVYSIALKQYRETNDVGASNFILQDGEKLNFSTLKTAGSDGLYLPADLRYEIVGAKKAFDVKNEDVTIVFSASTDDLTVIKSYSFHPDSYSFDLNVQLVSNCDLLKGKLDLTLLSPWDHDGKKQMYTFVGPVTFNGEKLEQSKPKDLAESPRIYKNDIVWSGYVSKYFLYAVSPSEAIAQLFISSGDGFIENRFTSSKFTLTQGQKTSFDYATYFGPKQDEYLQCGGHQFDKAIDYGFFHPISKPLMVVLKFFYSLIGNYGFSVILLTVCIKLLFWPLTQKSYKSMKGMQKLQPEMKKMREKYGKDKQKLNQEMMSFYKDNKVNPMGGCLPMLIQIPVFFALYRVLLGSIELRHAPFMLWITDLSVKDPYYVTPLIMGVTMFLQQKMTPTNMDPTQEKIMLMMPLVFTFMFLNFPAGLVLYWLTNNLLTILQQYLIRRQPD